MTEQTDIRLAASFFVKRFREDAPHEAALRARELANHGDREGLKIWLEIEEYAKNLLANGDHETEY